MNTPIDLIIELDSWHTLTSFSGKIGEDCLSNNQIFLVKDGDLPVVLNFRSDVTTPQLHSNGPSRYFVDLPHEYFGTYLDAFNALPEGEIIVGLKEASTLQASVTIGSKGNFPF